MALLGQSKAELHKKDELNKNCDETNGTQGQRTHAIHSDDFLEKLENIFAEKSPRCSEFIQDDTKGETSFGHKITIDQTSVLIVDDN